VSDDNFELALNQYDDIPNDNLVPTSNIEGLTGLVVNNKNIENLTGIEDFISLTSLDVSDNKLTWIDLSNNGELITLLVFRNLLTELDVSNKPKLINLIAYRNRLTNIVFNNTPSLEKFSCSNNQVKNLDFSQNNKLTDMWLHNNDLESLNVKNGNNTSISYFSAFGNKKLNCIEVDNAAYSTANWIRIDTWASFSEDCGY